MNEEQEKMWDRLKYVRPVKPNLTAEELKQMWMFTARSLGKTTMAMQALGRAMRNEGKDTD